MSASENLSQLITRRLSDLGLTQAELARRSGVSDRTISTWKRGTRGKHVDADLLRAVAPHLKVSAREILEASGRSVPTITDEEAERRLITRYRAATPRERRILDGVAELIHRRDE